MPSSPRHWTTNRVRARERRLTLLWTINRELDHETNEALEHSEPALRAQELR
jgi:hypothetical protein